MYKYLKSLLFALMFYLYVIHFEDFYYYVGKRKCPDKYSPWTDPYMGSPKTNKNKWKTTNHIKCVIECFDNDVDVSLAETNLLLELDWEKDPYCLNECCGGKFSHEANKRGALVRNQLPTKESTREKISQLNFQRWADPNWEKKEKIIKILKDNQRKAVEAANTPEAREKRRKTLKENNHQQGEKNSQYGTKLIYNLELRETKRIKREDPIPEGWNLGAIYDFDAYFERKKKNEEKKEKTRKEKECTRNEKIKFYTEWYQIYQKTDFIKFCEITGYSKSQQNLCDKFKRYVDEYTPKVNNGK